jgi:tetratricopeptide (TPR) repeat protein
MSDQHREQLKRAYQLMKQGERPQAAKIIQRVLQQDKSNADAWWLLANALERDDLKIKSLKRVLSLRPDDTRARKMLDDLQSTDDDGFDDFFDTPSSSSGQPAQQPPEKPKNDDFKLKKELPEVAADNDNEMSNVVFFGSVAVIVVIGGLLLAALALPILNDLGGNSPQDTVNEAIEAVRNLDVQRLEELTCEAERSQFNSELDAFGMQGMTLDEALAEEDIELDLSQLDSEVVSVDGDRAQVRLTGSVSISAQGISMTFDMEELMNQAEIDADDALIPLVREDGEWRLCTP